MARISFAVSREVGQSIPNTAHAVSVSLPSWKANVGYEEGEEWVLSKMKNGYPRFFIHLSIQAFASAIVSKHGNPGETAMLFPSIAVARRCLAFLIAKSPVQDGEGDELSLAMHGRVVELVLRGEQHSAGPPSRADTLIAAVIFPESLAPIAKAFWQHTGDGISSRRAEFCLKAFQDGHITPRDHVNQGLSTPNPVQKGPRRYQRGASIDKGDPLRQDSTTADSQLDASSTTEKGDYSQFVEERFGRNLDLSLTNQAKVAIRRRIAGSLTADVDLKEALNIPGHPDVTRKVEGFSEDDVYLFPAGMSAIYNMHRILLKARGPLKSISFGFPYIDTLKVLEKFGPGCIFYGHGSSADLDDLEERCLNGERFLALFCEFPGNPLLQSPDLRRIRRIADKYDFAVVIDETIGNFMNIHVLPLADVLVSSLTKIFSGDSNVMGGSCILNPRRRYYSSLRTTMLTEYEDNYWPEDAVFMERNSRDFVSRIGRVNVNAEAICEVLQKSRHIKRVYYPLLNPCRANYDAFRQPNGGYGGLLSVTFHSAAAAMTFFDELDIAKGPSLGTNFTLCSPFVILAHYNELEWAASFGVEADLIRFSIGLEEANVLTSKFEAALAALDAM